MATCCIRAWEAGKDGCQSWVTKTKFTETGHLFLRKGSIFVTKNSPACWYSDKNDFSQTVISAIILPLLRYFTQYMRYRNFFLMLGGFLESCI